METDQENPNRILYSVGSALLSTSGSETFIIVGGEEFGYQEGNAFEARFDYISGFTQFNSTTIIIADKLKSCLRAFDHITETTSPLMGSCVKSRELQPIERHFQPHSVIKDKRSITGIYLADQNSAHVLHIDLQTLESWILPNWPKSMEPSRLAYNTIGFDFFAIGPNFIAKYDDNADSFSVVAGSNYYRGDDNIGPSLFHWLTDLVLASYNVILVAEAISKEVKVINLSTGFIATVCISNLVNNEDNLLQICDFDFPQSLLIHNNTLLVGDSAKILALPSKLLVVTSY